MKSPVKTVALSMCVGGEVVSSSMSPLLPSVCQTLFTQRSLCSPCTLQTQMGCDQLCSGSPAPFVDISQGPGAELLFPDCSSGQWFWPRAPLASCFHSQYKAFFLQTEPGKHPTCAPIWPSQYRRLTWKSPLHAFWSLRIGPCSGPGVQNPSMPPQWCSGISVLGGARGTPALFLLLV